MRVMRAEAYLKRYGYKRYVIWLNGHMAKFYGLWFVRHSWTPDLDAEYYFYDNPI